MVLDVALPSHTSHEPKPLDLTVFGTYNYNMQQELYRAVWFQAVIYALDILICIQNAYARSFTILDTRNGFLNNVLWDDRRKGTNVDP